jgi:hypothetical protein
MTYSKTKSLSNEQIAEGADTTDDQGVEERQEEQAPSVGVSESLSGLVRIPLGVLDTLVIGSDPLDQFCLLFLASPSRLSWRVW